MKFIYNISKEFQLELIKKNKCAEPIRREVEIPDEQIYNSDIINVFFRNDLIGEDGRIIDVDATEICYSDYNYFELDYVARKVKRELMESDKLFFDKLLDKSDVWEYFINIITLKMAMWEYRDFIINMKYDEAIKICNKIEAETKERDNIEEKRGSNKKKWWRFGF